MAAIAPDLTLSKYETLLRNQIHTVKLRDSGKEYMSNNGKTVAAKVQAEVFCSCPQLCQRKLPKEIWTELFRQFYDLGISSLQNQFLQAHIVIKTIHAHNFEKSPGSNRRRVSCKYTIPIIEKNDNLSNYLRRQADRTVEVCQKAFMNIFGITEKRVRVQRERCIQYISKNSLHNAVALKSLSEINEKYLNGEDKQSDVSMTDESESNDKGDEPLDLSNPMERALRQIDIDKTGLYEMADKMGVPRSIVDKEMADKFEDMVRDNLRKQQRELLKSTKKEVTGITLRSLTQQVVGLEDNLTILPPQTLNNGDLTITPILGHDDVRNSDIMKVNSFFQNQLWKPEYIGLGNRTSFTSLFTENVA